MVIIACQKRFVNNRVISSAVLLWKEDSSWKIVTNFLSAEGSPMVCKLELTEDTSVVGGGDLAW